MISCAPGQIRERRTPGAGSRENRAAGAPGQITPGAGSRENRAAGAPGQIEKAACPDQPGRQREQRVRSDCAEDAEKDRNRRQICI